MIPIDYYKVKLLSNGINYEILPM